MRSLILVCALLALASSVGCVAYTPSYQTPDAVLTIELAENDFKTVNTHLKGSAECTYIFGAIPLGEVDIYSKALGQIRDQASMDGRPVQLVNYTEDHCVTNFFIMKKDKVTITADAIEFTK